MHTHTLENAHIPEMTIVNPRSVNKYYIYVCARVCVYVCIKYLFQESGDSFCNDDDGNDNNFML